MAGTVQTFLKVLIGASTKGFKKDMDDGEKAVQKFASETKSALDKFAEVFGVDLDEARKKTKALGEGLSTLGKGFTASAVGTTGLTKALQILKMALISTGVGALVVALAGLAAYFTQTEKGAKQLSTALAQIKAVAHTVLNNLLAVGEGVIKVMVWKFKDGWGKIKEGFKGFGRDILDAAEGAKRLSKAMYELAEIERNYNIYASEQNILLEEYRLKARDIDLSAQERLNSLLAAAKIEKKINEEGLNIAAEKIANAQLALSLDSDLKENKDALAAAYINYNNLIAQSIIFDRTLTREKNTLIKEIKAELAALKEANEITKIGGVGFSIAKPDTSKLLGAAGQMQGATKQIGEITSGLSGANDELRAMNATIEDSIGNLASGFGEWMGAFSAGLANFRDARQLVGSAFGDMLIQLGQISIKAGIGIEAIKMAFSSLGGVGAIAIGTALIAFGSSIKGSIAQINNARSAASAGYGSASSMATGGGSLFYNNSTQSRTKLVIDGTVTLKLAGADLLAILNSENTRIEIVT
jgi:hypothetical protein